jgi:hypothetical protein
MKSTAAAPLHGGTANLALSLGEDVISAAGVGMALWLPVIAFVVTLFAIVASVYLVRSALRHGARLLRLVTGREATVPAVEPNPPSS